MYFGSEFESTMKWLFALACVGVAAIIAAGGWMLWFLISHLVWLP